MSSAYCEVAIPVPLDGCFTYAVHGGQSPQRGARVVVPWREDRIVGVITAVDVPEPTRFKARPIESVLDPVPILTEAQMQLAEWIANYYIAPLGEVLRSMLPLTAEIRRSMVFRLTELGERKLYERTHQASLIEQDLEPDYQILNLLSERGAAKASQIRLATGACIDDLKSLMRRKWILREVLAQERDARRYERFVVLGPEKNAKRMTAKQQEILDLVHASDGKIPLDALRAKNISEASLKTLVHNHMLRIEKRPAPIYLGGIKPARGNFDLNLTQSDAVRTLISSIGSFKTFLLHGVTGSGKTAVYLEAMHEVLQKGMTVMMLVPEIGLTPQTVGLLNSTFGDKVALLHSALTPSERADQWHRIRQGAAPVVVGTRSAVFAPAPNLGLIVVDEEHDQSYKQEENPRYNARDVAIMRAKAAGCVIVLGSATPSLETWNNARQGKYGLISMPERVMHRPLPEVEVLDMRQEFKETGRAQVFSRALIEQVTTTLDRGEQALILLNRRGYSFAVMCRACGQKLECDNCAIALTYHKASVQEGDRVRKGQRLECHYCAAVHTVPGTCPKCGSEYLHYFGAGSEQAEELLRGLFPQARIGRMDRDTVNTRAKLEHLLARMHAGEINLLVGTQMLAKGHDLHGITLVGVVGCDHALSLPDFRAAERVFQLITQVSGRAGRGDAPGRVLVQTYYPEHYSIQAAKKHDFSVFAAQETRYRSSMLYPPYCVLTNILSLSENLDEAMGWAEQIATWLRSNAREGVRVMGPCAAPLARLKSVYRCHLILRSESRAAMNQTLHGLVGFVESAKIPRSNLIIDVDAQSLM